MAPVKPSIVLLYVCRDRGLATEMRSPTSGVDASTLGDVSQPADSPVFAFLAHPAMSTPVRASEIASC